MKRILLLSFLIGIAVFANAQTTYYWVGGAPVAPQNISILTNWNTSLDGSGSARTSTTGLDILVFDGTNYGGAIPTTGIDSVANNSAISCAQLKFINGANVAFVRPTSGTTTMTIAGDGTVAEDFVIENGCTLAVANGPGSQVFNMGGANNSGRVSGNFSMITGLQARIANGTSTGTTLVFTAGSTFTTNITAASAAYAFGNSSQSTEKWVTFQAGSTCYYDGGFSVMASSSTFQPVNFLPGSNFVMRVSNPAPGTGGSFFNRKGFANITVQNGATLTADGPINQIDTLAITNGSTFITHTSGQTVVLGNLNVQGTLNGPANSTNEIVMGGSVQQTISGTGSIVIPTLLVTDGANVVLGKAISVLKSAVINGKIDFGTNQLTGAGTFTARGGITSVAGTGTTASGAYLITGVTGATGLSRGISVSGAGLPANTRVISFTTNFDSIYISRPATATATNIALAFSSNAATLVTASTSGFDPTNGSVAVADVKTYNSKINYTINAATTMPFGITTGSTASFIDAGAVLFNAAATTNAGAHIYTSLQATAGKVTIRPLDSLWLQSGATLNGSYNNATYFITDVSGNNVGVLRRDNLTGSSSFPIGSSANYLPAVLTPVVASDFALNVFQGITNDGTPTGTPLTSLQKQTVVNAVWNVNRVNGSGNANLKLQWTAALEGTTFATFANSEIGIIKNTGTTYSLPFGVGDNVANTADTLFSVFGQFSAGARPPANPFVFNALPPKTYGDADFSPGVISSNTTTPITYTSSNTAVATIVGGNTIHITGVGTTTITAQQASDGFYPAANVSQTLTVSKAPLTIRADRKIKPEGDPNPVLTATYTGFVLGETTSVLLTPAVLSTTATTASAPGNYLITVSGATATNYAITFVNDSLIVKPRTAQVITFPAFVTKTYGNPDFGTGATSSNNTIPITFVSSNTNVATIVGSSIHIVGAGTTTIMASQAGSDLFFAAPNLSQTLTVNKAPLTIRVADTTKQYGQPNPTFRIIYTGFVLGETQSVFSTQTTVSTTATTNSAPGYYSLDPTGTVAPNYNITYVSGRLTVYPASGTTQANLQAFVSNGSTLSVRVYSPEPDLGDIFIYDMSGRPMARKNIFIAPGFVTAYFAVDNMPSGIYIVQVIAKNTKLKITIPVIR